MFSYQLVNIGRNKQFYVLLQNGIFILSFFTEGTQAFANDMKCVFVIIFKEIIAE